jgi:hypothetical protein
VFEPPIFWRSGGDPTGTGHVVLVRLLFFLAISAIAVAGVLYLFGRDRRYLRFIWQVIKFTILILAIVLIFFAFERLVGPML